MDASEEYTDAHSDAGSSDSGENYSEASSDPPVSNQLTVPVPRGNTDESIRDHQVDDTDLFGSGPSSDTGSPERSSEKEGFTDLGTSEKLHSMDSSFEVLSHSGSTDFQDDVDEQTPEDEGRSSTGEHETEQTHNDSKKMKPPSVPPKPEPGSQSSNLIETSVPDRQSENTVQIGDEPGETSDDTGSHQNESKTDVDSDSDSEKRTRGNGQDIRENDDPQSNIGNTQPRSDNLESNRETDQPIPQTDLQNRGQDHSGVNNIDLEVDTSENGGNLPDNKASERNTCDESSEETLDLSEKRTDGSHHQEMRQLNDQGFHQLYSPAEQRDLSKEQATLAKGIGEEQTGFGEDKTAQCAQETRTHSSQPNHSSHPEHRPSDCGESSEESFDFKEKRTDGSQHQESNQPIPQADLQNRGQDHSGADNIDLEMHTSEDGGNLPDKKTTERNTCDESSEETLDLKEERTDGSYHQEMLQLNDQRFHQLYSRVVQQDLSKEQTTLAKDIDEGQTWLGEDKTAQCVRQTENFSSNSNDPLHPEHTPLDLPREQTGNVSHHPSKLLDGETRDEEFKQQGKSETDQCTNVPVAEHNIYTSRHGQDTHMSTSTRRDPNQYPSISRHDQSQELSESDQQNQQTHSPGLSLSADISHVTSSQHTYDLSSHHGHSLHSQNQANLSDPQLQQAEGMTVLGEVPKVHAGFMGRGRHESIPNQGFPYHQGHGRFQQPFQPMYRQDIEIDPTTGFPVQPPPPYSGPYYTNPSGSQVPFQRQQVWHHHQQQHPQYQQNYQEKHQHQETHSQFQQQNPQFQQHSLQYQQNYRQNHQQYQQQHMQCGYQQHPSQQQQKETHYRQQQQQQPTETCQVQPIPGNSVEQSGEKKTENESIKTVRVEGISGLTSETLQLYFESKKRSRGGDVKDITVDDKLGTAVVTFISEEAARRVAEKKNHNLSNQALVVFLDVPSKASLSTSTIMVSGFPSSVTKETLELYFESTKRSRGGTILETKIVRDIAYITFKEDGIAENVVSKTDHELSQCPLSVRLHHGSTADHQARTLVVSGYSPTIMNDTIEMYFESRKVSGGCEVEIRRERDCCYVTFDSDEAIERVLSCDKHVLEKHIMTVKRPGREDPTKIQSSPDKTTDKGPILTVEVKGYGEKATQDSISLYFENKRKSGGGEIDEMHMDERNGVSYITFKSEDTVKRVLSQQHILSGQKLQVKLSIPQVMYQDKVLFTGVPTQISQESLTDYLEARTSLEVDEILYGEEEGELLVTFSDAITDLKKLTESMSAKPFKREGKKIVFKVLQIPQTNTITVHKLPEKATEDLILSYFENNRRSGGGDVVEVKLQKQEGYAVVQFTESEVADAVVKRQHALCKTKVYVSLHFECLGERGGSTEPPLSKLPDPIKIKKIDDFILKHLDKNQQTLQEFREILSEVYVNIDIHLDVKEVTLTPTLTLSSPNVKTVIKTWHEKAKEACESFLEILAAYRTTVNRDIWSDVDHAVTEIRGTQDIEIFTEENNCSIVVTGPKEKAMETSDRIRQIIHTTQLKYDRKKNEITKCVKFNSAKLRLLFTERVFEEVFVSEVNVNINVEAGDVTLTGQKADIKLVQMGIMEKLQNVKQQTISGHFSQNQMELLKCPTVYKYLEKKLEDQPKPITGHWEPCREGITVYYIKEEGVDEVLAFLKASIKESKHKLDPENLPLLSSTSFQQRIDLLTDEHDRRIIITPDEQGKQIIITAVSCDVAATESEVQNYIDKNSIYTEQFKCDKMKVKFLIQHCQKELRKIKIDMKQFCLDLDCDIQNSCIYVKSTKSGLPPAKKVLHGITQKIVAHKQLLNRPGLKQYLECESLLKRVEKEIRCVITLKEHLDAAQEEDDYEDDSDVTHSIAFVCQYDNTRQLHIAVGDLVSLVSTVDVVVVEATPNLGSDSNQAWDVIRKAGEEAVSEVRSFASRTGTMMEGEIFCSGAGNLNCKNIVFAVGPTQMTGQSEIIKAVVIESLEEALKKNKQSVALPAFNTSMVTSPNDALRAVVEAVYTFYDENRNSRVINIYLCAEDWSQSRLLWNVAMEMFGQENVKSNVDEISPTDSLHGGNRRGMGRRKESMRDQSLAPMGEDLGATAGVDVDLSSPSGHQLTRPRILLVKADMGVEEADVIVNSSNTDLSLNRGQVSISLLKHAGPAIQEECRQKYPNGLKMGDIAVTKGGNMQCVEEIYHCTLPQWKNDTGKQTFTDVMKKLLEKAHSAGWKTMAIPALGTGNLGYSRDLVAKLMYETVKQFGKDMPETTINDVLFIVYPGDSKTIAAFEKEHRTYVEAAGGRVASSEKEIEEERMVELSDYRAKQGYAEKFGHVTKEVQSTVSRLAHGAKAMFMSRINTKPSTAETSKRAPVPKAPPIPKPLTLPRPVSKQSEVPLWIYTDDESNVAKAVDMIYADWDKKATRKHIDDDSLRSWTDEQIEELIQIENKYGVQINVNKDQGRIGVYGLIDTVSDACGSIYETIRKIEKDNSEKEYAEELPKIVQWCLVEITKDGDDKIVSYDNNVNAKLERAYTRDKKKELRYGGYVFDFDNWVEYPDDDPADQVQIIRRDKIAAASSQFPDTWDLSRDKDVQLIQVNSGARDFTTVKNKFAESMGDTPGQIVRLDRIQSKTLYQQYQAKKQQMERQNPGVSVERSLWHGTKMDATVSISTYGFNRSYCDKEQNALGEGAYFTTNAGYAARDRYAPADSQGRRYMFMCKVLTGSFTKGQPKIRVAPPKDQQNSQILYDSVVDDPANPQTFVIFSDTQAYPEYLISFQ